MARAVADKPRNRFAGRGPREDKEAKGGIHVCPRDPRPSAVSDPKIVFFRHDSPRTGHGRIHRRDLHRDRSTSSSFATIPLDNARAGLGPWIRLLELGLGLGALCGPTRLLFWLRRSRAGSPLFRNLRYLRGLLFQTRRQERVGGNLLHPPNSRQAAATPSRPNLPCESVLLRLGIAFSCDDFPRSRIQYGPRRAAAATRDAFRPEMPDRRSS